MPLPGTEFYRWLREEKYLSTEDYSSWLNEHGLQKCVIDYPGLSSEQIERYVYASIRRYYFSGHFFANAALQIMHNPYELKRYATGGMRFLQFLFKNG